jgi:GPI ethanolamine phosphate transferase 1
MVDFMQVQSYFHREIFTVCFIIAAFWPLFYGKEFISRHIALTSAWAIGCSLMSIFTLLPVIKVEDTTTMYVYIGCLGFESFLTVDV